MNFRDLNPSLNSGGKANMFGGNVGDSERIAKTHTLDELTEGAREYKEFLETNRATRRELDRQQAELSKKLLDLQKEEAECSFGQLLTSAIGIKIRDEKAES